MDTVALWKTRYQIRMSGRLSPPGDLEGGTLLYLPSLAAAGATIPIVSDMSVTHFHLCIHIYMSTFFPPSGLSLKRSY